MFKFLTLVSVLVLAAVVVPSIQRAVSWVLAFFILLMLGDLLLNQASKLWRRAR